MYNLNTISILDGGLFAYHGTAENDDVLTVNLAGDLVIRGGGEMWANRLRLTGTCRAFRVRKYLVSS